MLSLPQDGAWLGSLQENQCGSREPAVLLLDEPRAALDQKLRTRMQVEMKAMQEQLGTTFVFVTHDQREALVMSDRIAVINEGRICPAPRPAYHDVACEDVRDRRGRK